MTDLQSRRRLLKATGAAALTSYANSCALQNAVAGVQTIRIRELYHKDLSFSDLALTLNGNRVAIKGYMAPPLKAASQFFVLTKRPMSTCPFCNEAEEWPDDIVAVYTKRLVDVQPFNAGIIVNGRLDLSDYQDPETGFYSRVRVVNASFQRS